LHSTECSFSVLGFPFCDNALFAHIGPGSFATFAAIRRAVRSSRRRRAGLPARRCFSAAGDMPTGGYTVRFRRDMTAIMKDKERIEEMLKGKVASVRTETSPH
jgi:hypothetical protein